MVKKGSELTLGATELRANKKESPARTDRAIGEGGKEFEEK